MVFPQRPARSPDGNPSLFARAMYVLLERCRVLDARAAQLAALAEELAGGDASAHRVRPTALTIMQTCLLLTTARAGMSPWPAVLDAAMRRSGVLAQLSRAQLALLAYHPAGALQPCMCEALLAASAYPPATGGAPAADSAGYMYGSAQALTGVPLHLLLALALGHLERADQGSWYGLPEPLRLSVARGLSAGDAPPFLEAGLPVVGAALFAMEGCAAVGSRELRWCGPIEMALRAGRAAVAAAPQGGEASRPVGRARVARAASLAALSLGVSATWLSAAPRRPGWWQAAARGWWALARDARRLPMTASDLVPHKLVKALWQLGGPALAAGGARRCGRLAFPRLFSCALLPYSCALAS
jgi:hypothetical protein